MSEELVKYVLVEADGCKGCCMHCPSNDDFPCSATSDDPLCSDLDSFRSYQLRIVPADFHDNPYAD